MKEDLCLNDFLDPRLFGRVGRAQILVSIRANNDIDDRWEHIRRQEALIKQMSKRILVSTVKCIPLVILLQVFDVAWWWV